MMLKVGSEYLDFNGSVEVERKIKLFEDLSTSDGDVSFQFEVEDTNKNTRLLSYPVPDSSTKRVYNRISCDLQDDSGVSLYEGFLRIEQRKKRTIALSFFSGNSNWFGMIEGNLSDLDFSAYDIEQTQANIEASWTLTEGLVFPLIDHGGLITRSYPILKIEDFVGSFYVKTIFKRVFSSAGIKIQGELLKDWRFQNMLCANITKDQDQINARSTFARVTNSDTDHASETYVKVIFSDDSTFPYFDGEQNNFDLPNSRYVADVKMVVDVEFIINNLVVATPLGIYAIDFYINGVYYSETVFSNPNVPQPLSHKDRIPLNAGDYLEVFVLDDADIFADPLTDATLKVTPIYLYKTFGKSAVPNWTSQKLVSNVLKIFNAITSYDAPTATLTLNIFEKITEKDPIDLSQYLSEIDVDYTEFISDYGQKSLLGYTKIDYDELKEYNQGKILNYGQGVINVNNDFLKEREEILISDFANPIAYRNPVFNTSLEKTNLILIEEGDRYEFGDVADDGSGNAAFNIGDNTILVGDLIRIKDSSNQRYNGDWVVSGTPTTHIVLHGVFFDTAADGTVYKLDYKNSEDDNVFIFINIPNYSITKFAGTTPFFNNDTDTPDEITSMSYAYFDLIDTGMEVNDEYKQGLAFGSPEDLLRYMRTMTQDYWSLVERVLNDPVKPICTGVMPSNVYRSIDFLRPIMIKSLDTSNKYYLNLISGYKSSAEPCIMEMIKLP